MPLRTESKFRVGDVVRLKSSRGRVLDDPQMTITVVDVAYQPYARPLFENAAVSIEGVQLTWFDALSKIRVTVLPIDALEKVGE